MIRNKAIWLEPQVLNIPAEILQYSGGNKFLAGELILRGIQSAADASRFLEPANYTPSSPYDLADMEIAVEILLRAIRRGDVIGVWGDFDVDGQTSTSVLVDGLCKLGARVIHHIPVRGLESHGMNIKILEHFLGNKVDLLLSCDTGITSHQAVDYAKSRGVKVIITDHHSLPDVLPRSDANINPRRLPETHPLAGLCGVGTAYKLIEALFQSTNRESELNTFLDLVALGTIADLADLRGDNRYLVQKGLNELRSSKRPALKAMMEAANIMMDSISEEHVSFALAPRLNSIGRLGDANPIVNFFSSNDLQEIRVMASHLEGLNIHRRLIVDQVILAALDQIENHPELIKGPFLILENRKWPGGIIGIAASRLVELYHLPTILLTIDDEGLARGSARSIEGINITQAIGEQAAILESYGGHPMAAGLSLKAENIPDFRRGLGASIVKMTTGMDLTPQLQIHSYLELSEISSTVIDALELLAPYGPGNPLPVLVSKDLFIKSSMAIGKSEDHTQLILEDNMGGHHKVIWWQSSALPIPEGRFDLAYSMRKSNYRGKEEIQIQWVDFRQIEPASLTPTTSRPEVQIIDLRSSSSQEEIIQSLVKDFDPLIWAEGITQFQFPCVNRLYLKPTNNLVIASIPPSFQVLKEILTITRPRNIYLLKFDSENDQIQIFLQQLSGLVLYTINHRGGWLLYKELAAKLCHTEKSVQTGIQWLIANGTIQAKDYMGETVCIDRDGTKDKILLPHITKKLNDLLNETRAYRRYTLTANQNLWLGTMDNQETGIKTGNQLGT